MSSTITDYLKTGNAQSGAVIWPIADLRVPEISAKTVYYHGVNEESYFISLAHALDKQWLTDLALLIVRIRKTNAEALVEELEAELQTQTAADWEPP